MFYKPTSIVLDVAKEAACRSFLCAHIAASLLISSCYSEIPKQCIIIIQWKIVLHHLKICEIVKRCL